MTLRDTPSITAAGAALDRWVIDSALDFATVVTDLNGRVTAWSAGAEVITGWAEQEMLGQTVDRIFTPEDRASDRPALEMRCAQETGAGDDERWHLRKGGARFWASGQMTPLRSDAGEMIGYVKVLRDRTEQRVAAEKNRADAEFLERLLSASGDCIKVLDLNGKLLSMNERALELMEVSDFNAIRGCYWPRFWEDAGHSEARAALESARQGRSARFSGPADTMGGTTRWWDVQVTPILDRDGRPERLLVVSRDVTDSLSAADALREGEARWRDLFARLREGFILGELVRSADGEVVDWRYVEVNRAWGELVGIDPATAAGRTIREVFPGIEQSWVDEMAAVVATGEASNFTRRVGSLARWYEGRAFPLEGDRFGVLFLEVTERVEADARRIAIQELSDGLRDMTDLEGMAQVASEIMGRTLGVSAAGYGVMDETGEVMTVEREWTEEGFGSVVGRHQMSDFGTYVENLRRGEPVTIADVLTDPRTADRAEAMAAVHTRSLVNMPIMEGGRLVAAFFLLSRQPTEWTPETVGFISSIAERTRSAIERRRAEQALQHLADTLEQQVEDRTRELRQAEERLRQSAKMEAVGQLTGGLAHDFNNLLTGITGSLELLGARVAQGRLKDVDRYIGAAQGAAKRAAALTHRLLAFSRRQTLDPSPTDVNSLIAGMEDLIRRTIGPAVTLEVVGAGGLWPALVDANQLDNALLNLCINARDAMPEGGRITIETANKWLDERGAAERDLPPGQYLSICVTDTGSGMPPEVIARAFDPFFTTKPLGQGTGLGLSMIYGFVRQSGGQVRVYSELGQGTTMCLYLPRHHGARPAESAPGEGAGASRAEQGETVLIVDDEPTVRMLVTEVLEDLGYTAIEAADGPAGLKVLQSNVRIDLLVTDVGLPGGMNGRQVADAARIGRPELKVLFITGYAENAAVGNGHLDPGMHLLTKPFSMEDLGRRIRLIIEG